MRVKALLRHNIDALLSARGLTRKDLAQWCRRKESWLSKALSDDPKNANRELPTKYWDRIADFFGLATYQLIQPGISPLTERRGGADRRRGRDRRIETSVRIVFNDMERDRALVHEMLSLEPDERQRLLRLLADHKRKKLLPPPK